MLDLLLFPFRFAWGILEGVFGLIGGLFSMVFGLIGGLFGLVGGVIGLVIKLTMIGLVIGVIVEFVRRHRVRKNEGSRQEDFISYYDKDAVR